MKKLLLIQPGAFGDLFVCAPIARRYSKQGYTIDWPVREKFLPTLHYFDYVNPIQISEETFDEDWLRSDVMKILPLSKYYDKVINLADRGPHLTAQRAWENFEQCKYRISKVPFGEKFNLEWTRNKKKEKQLFKLLGLSDGDEYAVVHRVDSANQVAEIPNINVKIVEVLPIDGFNIPDWFLVFKNAKQIFCIESSVHQFMDGVGNQLPEERFLLKRPSVAPNCRFTVSHNWKLDYIGHNSRIHG